MLRSAATKFQQSSEGAMRHIEKDAARPESVGGEISNQRQKNITPAPLRKSKCARLTPAQHGRFEPSVGKAIPSAWTAIVAGEGRGHRECERLAYSS